MLGLRCAFKEEIKATVAEMVYGQTLRLPPDFFTEEPTAGNETEFVEKFRKIMRKIRPIQTSHHTTEKPFVHKDLQTTENVFVRDDTVLKPLQQPYEGPFRVIKRKEKSYKIDLKGKPKYVTIDRLKPAFVENDDDQILQQPSPNKINQRTDTRFIPISTDEHSSPLVQPDTTAVRTTRSGRQVRFPKRLNL